LIRSCAQPPDSLEPAKPSPSSACLGFVRPWESHSRTAQERSGRKLYTIPITLLVSSPFSFPPQFTLISSPSVTVDVARFWRQLGKALSQSRASRVIADSRVHQSTLTTLVHKSHNPTLTVISSLPTSLVERLSNPDFLTFP
jgi:hypothetical protein